jgi:hypothetical protein
MSQRRTCVGFVGWIKQLNFTIPFFDLINEKTALLNWQQRQQDLGQTERGTVRIGVGVTRGTVRINVSVTHILSTP